MVSFEYNQKGFTVILESSSLNEYALGQLSLSATGQQDKTDISVQIMKKMAETGDVKRHVNLYILLERCFSLGGGSVFVCLFVWLFSG